MSGTQVRFVIINLNAHLMKKKIDISLDSDFYTVYFFDYILVAICFTEIYYN